MTATPAVELREVTVTYNQGTPNEVVALRNVSLSIPRGQTLVLTGGNGSGKSTLLRAIAGTAPVTDGTIHIGGINVTSWPPYRRARLLGFIYQDPMLGTCPNISVHENLCLSDSRPWGSLSPERRRINDQQLRLIAQSGLALETKLATPIGMLSGGQRQTIAVIQAVSSLRSILLMDEFTSALDTRVRTACLRMITDEQRQRLLTIITVLHALEDIDIVEYRRIHLSGGVLQSFQ